MSINGIVHEGKGAQGLKQCRCMNVKCMNACQSLGSIFLCYPNMQQEFFPINTTLLIAWFRSTDGAGGALNYAVPTFEQN